MATTAFVSSGLEFVPNNYTAPLNTANAPEAFHMIQRFLAQSAIWRALVEPATLSGLQIKALWETGVYDDGGETGSPSIIFEIDETEYVITAGTIRAAMGFPEYSSYTIGMGDEDLIRMMREIGYSGPLTKIGQLKRPFLRKEWSFFFDCITRTFGKKCTNWDAIPTDSLQIGYSLLYDNHFDFARLVLTNLGEKMTENRGVVYFSRFCQLLFSYCVEGENVFEADVSCFKLHKRVFTDLVNKDIKKGIVGDLLLPTSVQQFVDAQVNPQPQAESQSEPSSTSVKPAMGGRTKHIGTKPARNPSTKAGASTPEELPQKTRLKKRRANRVQSVVETSETETDEETLHQRKRRLVAAHLFGAVNVTMDRVSKDTEAPASENEEIVAEAVPQATPEIAVEEDIINADEDRVFVNTEAPEVFVQEDAANAEAVNLDRLNTDATMDLDAPTSKANDVVEEAATHSDSRVFDIEAHTSIYSDLYTEGVEADQVTDQVEESLATHTEIISCDLDKGEEVTQLIKVTEKIDEAVMEKEQEATDELNSENIILEALQQSVVEIVQREAEVFAQATSDIPEAVAEENIDEAAQFTADNILNAHEAVNNEETGNDAEGSHSHPSIQVSLADDVISADAREVHRQTNEHFQNMYYKNWADADCVFPVQRAADFLSDSVKKISNTDVLTSLQATVVQVKSLNNRFDENQLMLTNLRNEASMKDLTFKSDRTFYYTMLKQQAKDSEEIKKRLGKVEENQTAMSTQMSSISTAIELLTSVLLSDDVKKGESVSKDKCKDTRALRRKDDSTDGGSKGNKRKIFAPRQSRTRVNSEKINSGRQINSEKINSGGQSTSNLKSLVVSTNPSTDEEIAAKIFMKEHGKNVTIEDIQAEEQMLAEEHKKNLEAGIYKRKEIKAPRKKEVGISIKENIQQSVQNTRRPVIRNSDKGKGIMIEEPNLKKKDISTSNIAQVETRLAKSTSDAAQVDVSIEDMTTSDVAQVVQKSTLLPGFSKSKILEDLKLEAVNFSETRTVLGKEAFDKSGLGSHRERRTNNRSQDKFSLARIWSWNYSRKP
ncbi:hypothetical protein POM88_021444 [Heracleum sosnowskyi]|uniref:Uncharacterized protein n=1 Tax=Heracleum sosnowskyi TaxID=360622 RepID=A0AAD8IDD7_9APIA|nr:hypothetical protein POM88_021444 [Heracleum sosnowskyi]